MLLSKSISKADWPVARQDFSAERRLGSRAETEDAEIQTNRMGRVHMR